MRLTVQDRVIRRVTQQYNGVRDNKRFFLIEAGAAKKASAKESSRIGARDPTAQAQVRGAIGSLRVVIVKPGVGTMEKGSTRWETKVRRIKIRLGNRK